MLHLSDLHIPQMLGPDSHGVDARAVLARLLDDCQRVPAIDVVVVSGDVADDGSPEGYAAALELVGGFCQERGAAQVWCTGNHDARAPFAAVLGSGHMDSTGIDVGRLAPSSIDERAAVSEVAGLRIITLDSLIPHEVPGRVSRDQLEWLREVLAHPAPSGSVVVLHHPPVSVSKEWAGASLQDASALADIVRGSDVQAILCGHVHAQVAGQLAGVPVWVGPGVVTRIDLTAPAGVVRAVRGAGATVVELGRSHSPMFYVLHARDPRAGEQVYLASATTWQYLESENETEVPTTS